MMISSWLYLRFVKSLLMCRSGSRLRVVVVLSVLVVLLIVDLTSCLSACSVCPYDVGYFRQLPVG